MFPLVAILRAVRAADPAAETLFVCGDAPREKAWLAHEDVGELRTLPSPGTLWKSPLSWLQNARAAKRLLEEFRPDAVITKGGAVSIPLCRIAHARGIPVLLHESDAVMGRANALMARFADTVCLGIPGAAPHHPDAVFTGNPVRPDVTRGDRAEGLRIAGLAGKKPILLVLGGSQGAAALNDAVRTNIDALLETVYVIHVTGEGKPGAEARSGYFALPFARTELPHLYAAADLALSRAGAGLIAELAACAVPAVLVPLEGLAQDHQTANARAAEAAGGCVLLRQKDLAEKLVPLVAVLTADDKRRSGMREMLRTAARPDAAQNIARLALDHAKRHRAGNPAR